MFQFHRNRIAKVKQCAKSTMGGQTMKKYTPHFSTTKYTDKSPKNKPIVGYLRGGSPSGSPQWPMGISWDSDLTIYPLTLVTIGIPLLGYPYFLWPCFFLCIFYLSRSASFSGSIIALHCWFIYCIHMPLGS